MILDEHGKPIDQDNVRLREMLTHMPTLDKFGERHTALEAGWRVAELRASCGVKTETIVRFRRYKPTTEEPLP